MRTSATFRQFIVLLASGMLTAGSLAQNTAESDTKTALLTGAPVSHAEAGSAKEMSRLDAVSQYPVGVSDVLHVSVWKNNDLSQTVTVGPDGFISLPLLGDVQVSGMTTSQLATMLSSRLTSYMVNPEVTVSVVEIHSRQVYLIGQVAKPGRFPLIGPTTVLQLIAQAGGLTIFAKRKDIYVLRVTKNGQTEKIPFNYNNVIRGKGSENVNLQPGDTVFVP